LNKKEEAITDPKELEPLIKNGKTHYLVKKLLTMQKLENPYPKIIVKIN